MDYLKKFFKTAVSKYVDVVRDDMITFGYDKGMEIRDLRLNTKLINDLLQASDMEARLEFGRIGRMNLVYTPLPGIVTIQVKDLDIRVRPNFTGLALRKLVETLQELGDMDNVDFAPSPPPFPSACPPAFACGPCPGSSCAPRSGPEIHNTQARLVHPCRIPRAPPIVRRARFVTALPGAPPHFQQPIRGSACEGLQNCLQGFARSQDACLDKLCDEFSLLSNSLMASCGATSERVVGGCEEIKNMLSNCVESMAGLAPPAYDELDKIQLPSFRVRTSEICKDRQPQPSQQTTGNEAHLPPSTFQHVQGPNQSKGLRPVMTFSHRPWPNNKKAVIIRPTSLQRGAEQPSPRHLGPHSMAPSQNVGPPAAQFAGQTQPRAGLYFVPAPHPSFGMMPHAVHPQAASPYPYTPPTGMAASSDPAFPFNSNVWGGPAAVNSQCSFTPMPQTMQSQMQPPPAAVPGYFGGSYHPAPGDYLTSHQGNEASGFPPRGAAITPSPSPQGSANTPSIYVSGPPTSRRDPNAQ